MKVNPKLIPLQRALGLEPDGLRGPVTTAAILEAADDGRLQLAAPATPLPWLAEGYKVLGLHENRDRAKLTEWLFSDGKRLGDPSKLPWCGDFVETCIKRALPAEPFTGALGENPYWARNWTTFGQKCSPVMRGAVVVFERGPSSGHVAFAVGQDDENIYCLGGNQSDKVSVVPIRRTRLLAARWPLTFAPPMEKLPAMTGGAISTNEA